MRRLATLVLLLSATMIRAQTEQPPATLQIPQTPQVPKTLETAVPLPPALSSNDPAPPETSLPDAPLPEDSGDGQVHQDSVVAVAEASFKASGGGKQPCGILNATKIIHVDPNHFKPVRKPCAELIIPYQRFLNTDVVTPLTWQQKGYLALHDLADPANFATIVGISAITIASNSHTAYGPGFAGFGKIAGVSLLEDATGQFFGVFAIPSLVHQDPRYFRMPHAPLHRRILYSISRTFVSRSDEGATIPNYATLLTYPITAEISNLYVPGIHPNGPSTVARIATGLATDPANNLLTEFLPDVAKRIHVRIIFVQTLLNNVAGGTNGVTLQ
jgi:hypothetical protein